MATRDNDQVLGYIGKVVGDALNQVQEWAIRNQGIADYNYKADSMELAQYHRGKADAYQEAYNHIANELGI